MSAFSATRRAEVTVRAGHRCEYCHLPTRGQVATFPIDHIIPKSAGGTTHPDNLALTCPHCNAHKWDVVEATDPMTGEVVRLFHPRQQDWADHFAWVPGTSELAGQTAVGRATIAALAINASDMIELRQLLMELGLFSESR